MEGDFVTLDTLFGTDPAADDNSDRQTSPTGATSPHDSQESPARPSPEDVTARVSELERLVERYRQQVSGSQSEIQRLRSEIQGQRQATHQPSTPTPAERPAPTRVSLREAVEAYVLNNDDEKLKAYEASAALQDDVRHITEQEFGRRTAEQEMAGQRARMQATLAERHGELLNPTQHQEFVTSTAYRYQELDADPTIALLYKPDPMYEFTEPSTGITYDWRKLMHAANDVKTRAQGQGQPPGSQPKGRPGQGASGFTAPPATLGTRSGGGSAPPSATPTSMVPRAYVQGENAVFADPTVQRALQAIGWGSNTKAQLNNLLKHLPADTKETWRRGGSR